MGTACCSRPSRVGRRPNRTGGESWCQQTESVGPGLQSEGGDTALHKAAYSGELEVARLLLESGADVNAKVTIASGCRLL